MHGGNDATRAKKRRKQSTDTDMNFQHVPPYQPAGSAMLPSILTIADPPMTARQDMEHNSQYSLTTLSMAAEQLAQQDAFAAPTGSLHQDSAMIPPGSHVSMSRNADPMAMHFPGLDFDASIDGLTSFIDNGPTYHFASMIGLEQPMPWFSPSDSFGYGPDLTNPGNHAYPSYNPDHDPVEEPTTFSTFGSRLPSLAPEERPAASQQQAKKRPSLTHITFEDRRKINAKLSRSSSLLPTDFALPSRLALSRYLAAYINGFHEHLPFLHISTMSAESCSIELILAMAAVGAQYCFEGAKGVELFHASRIIAARRIRRRDARLAGPNRQSEAGSPKSRRASTAFSSRAGSIVDANAINEPLSGPLGLPLDQEYDVPFSEKEDLVQTAQALLILMAMATWAKHKEILREALVIPSVLATLVRENGLRTPKPPADVTWQEWVRAETTKRTKLITYCFFNLHCIVYNIPPLILNSELKLPLPSSAAEFKASTAEEWQQARRAANPNSEQDFQHALERLFSRDGKDITEFNSSLGNYILIHALTQHIFFVRQSARYRYNHNGELLAEDVQTVEQALRNWQCGWTRNPESSIDPVNPYGPVAFNSTALLRLAYIRLNVDTGPGRALDTRDPIQIANAFRESPALKRNPKLTKAVLHSAHALSIPIMIGIRLVAQTQTFVWSIQHALCSLECAFLLSKWLEVLSTPNPDPPITVDEYKIGQAVKTMLGETDFAVPAHIQMESPATFKHLSAGVLRVWSTIFCGAQTWAIVDIIGTSLGIYADMLEAD